MELAECHGWLKRRGVVVLVVVMGGLFGGGGFERTQAVS